MTDWDNETHWALAGSTSREDKEDIAQAFSGEDDIGTVHTGEAILRDLDGATIWLARYRQEPYEGEAIVIYERDGTLFEVNAFHCSCYGLEGQWEPEQTSWGALAMRDDHHIQQLVREHVAHA